MPYYTVYCLNHRQHLVWSGERNNPPTECPGNGDHLIHKDRICVRNRNNMYEFITCPHSYKPDEEIYKKLLHENENIERKKKEDHAKLNY